MGEGRSGGHVGLPDIGSKYGRWTISGPGRQTKWGWWYCDVTCECGATAQVPYTNLIRGVSGECRSCAAKRRWGHKRIIPDEAQREHWINVHKNILSRCYDPACPSYPYYGARGITVDPSLHERSAWLEFVRDHLDPARIDLTVDRIDTYGNYVPGNLRLATMAEQNANRRTPTRQGVRPD